MRTLILIAAVLAATDAAAQTGGDTSIRPILCSIRSANLDFGRYSALDQAPNSTNALFEVNCPLSRDVEFVRLSVSPGRSGSHRVRTLTRGREHLRYNVYTDAGHQRVAGDGSNGTVAPVRIMVSGRATLRLYGSIPARQNVKAGNYDDTLRVDVEF